MTTAAQLNEAEVQKLEAELDPEMRFRPLLPAAASIVAVLLFGAVLLPLLHRRLRPAARDDASRHPYRLRAGPHLPRLLLEQEGQRGSTQGQCARAPGHRHCRLDLRHRGSDRQPVRAVGLSRSAVPRRQSPDHRLGDGHDHDRADAGGNPAQRRLAVADHRHRADGLCALGALVSGNSRSPRQHLEKRRQPSLPDEPGHFRRRPGRGGDLRVSLRAVRRA